jgi:hypothetical protein
MSNFTGLSVVLTVSLIALVTMQLLKDNFEQVEYFGETDNNGAPFAAVNTSTAGRVSEQNRPTEMGNNMMGGVSTHGMQPFAEGNTFRSAQTNSNPYNATPDMYRLYQLEVNAATPTQENFNAISSGTVALPGPNNFTGNDFAVAPSMESFSMCAQNMTNFPAGAVNGISASLLPNPNQGSQAESFQNTFNFTNALANQALLSASGRIGSDMSSGSLRNANLDLRSAPPNPIRVVSPWMNSTIYPDLLRRPLEENAPSFGMYGSGPGPNYATASAISS